MLSRPPLADAACQLQASNIWQPVLLRQKPCWRGREDYWGFIEHPLQATASAIVFSVSQLREGRVCSFDPLWQMKLNPKLWKFQVQGSQLAATPKSAMGPKSALFVGRLAATGAPKAPDQMHWSSPLHCGRPPGKQPGKVWSANHSLHQRACDNRPWTSSWT